MDPFGDQLSFNEFKEINAENFDNNSDVCKEIDEDLNDVKEIVNEMKQKCEQLITIENYCYEDKHQIEDNHDIEDKVQIEDKHEIEDNLQIEDKHEIEDNLQIEDKHEIEDNLQIEDKHEIEDNLQIEDKHEIEDNLQIEDKFEIEDIEELMKDVSLDVFNVNYEEIETKTDEVIDNLNDNKEKESTQLLSNKNEESVSVLKKNEMKMTRSEKWGESLGIFDENGVQRRVIDLNEMNNYLKLVLNSTKTDFNYYLSLINDRYPRFYDSTINYFQRWRMRYNVFVDNAFESPKSESLLHFGEIHLYFDLNPRSSQPYYVNNSFYANTLPIEIPVEEELISKMRRTLDSIRFGKDVFQLKFPIESQVFNNCNQIFDKFMERQTEFIEEAQSVHRKNELKRRFWNSGRGRAQNQSNAGFRRFSRNDSNQREFTSNDRNLDRNPVEFSDNNRDNTRNGRNNRGFDRNNKGFDRSNRGFDRSKRGFNRNDGGFDRELGQNSRSVRDKSLDMVLDSEVTFEDTLERQDRHESDKKMAPNKSRGFKRFNQNKGMEERKSFTSGSNIANSERNTFRNNSNDREFDENRRRNGDSFRGRERRRFSSSFKNSERNESNYNRNKQTVGETFSEPNSRSNFGNNFRQNNRSE